MHYDQTKEKFVTVGQKNGGGNCFITYTGTDPLKMEELVERACALFFAGGKNSFAGHIDEMNKWICDTTGVAIFDFPGKGTVEDYLKSTGLYPSSTYFYLCTQPRHLMGDEFEDSNYVEATNTDNTSPKKVSSVTVSVTACTTKSDDKEACNVCSCSFEKGQNCLRCEQDLEYQQSLMADSVDTEQPEEFQPESIQAIDQLTSFISPVSVHEMRELRLAHFQRDSCHPTVQSQDNHDQRLVSPSEEEVSPSTVDGSCGVLEEGGYVQLRTVGMPRESAECIVSENGKIAGQVLSLTVHRSCICKDMIEHFKDEKMLQSELVFTIINERGQKEEGVGIGVSREVFSLFWKEFANSMTIGERERVPFVRHDHFIKEWGAIGRILVKGFRSVSYFPLFLSKAFMCYCLFDAEVPEGIVLESFIKYLSPVEEELVTNFLGKADFADENDDLFDFLERFNCRSQVSPENIKKVLVEIANQELIQKPHVMVATWQPIVQELKQYPQFQTIAGIQGFYDRINPTNKKVLNSLEAQPNTEAERDALKFLQRYIRGLDNAKLVQFLRFTTASDVLITNKIEVSFTRLEGASSRHIAHPCGPLLELPSTYSNFVELRQQFNNILEKSSLEKSSWEMDIMIGREAMLTMKRID
ncbi:hypothetical protein AWC38_SpisGene11474 [Stylophora pistillata]|uniref:HECT domain-containing protein n=1 Tax=Stylophora pistillata TaxID=50429 RepID=A0A2B4RZQ2_STYPI|nr:hypothetical protein AWC38_SpisGene11474 [Stylophora pistillata]